MSFPTKYRLYSRKINLQLYKHKIDLRYFLNSKINTMAWWLGCRLNNLAWKELGVSIVCWRVSVGCGGVTEPWRNHGSDILRRAFWGLPPSAPPPPEVDILIIITLATTKYKVRILILLSITPLSSSSSSSSNTTISCF